MGSSPRVLVAGGVMLLLVGVLGCTDTRPLAAHSATLRLTCGHDEVVVELANLPWFARGYFAGVGAFVLHQASQDGGTILFEKRASWVDEADSGVITWEEPTYAASGSGQVDESRTVCTLLGGTPSAWYDCWRTCCRVGTAAPTLQPAAWCTENAGDSLRVSECGGSNKVCCKTYGDDALGPVSAALVGECLLGGGVAVDPDNCTCCLAPQEGMIVAGTCAAMFHVEDLTERMTSNDCCDDLGGEPWGWSACSDEFLSSPCGDDGWSCAEVCCATERGHELLREDQCPTAQVVAQGDCEFQASCCRLETDGVVRYESVPGNRRGSVEGTARFVVGTPGIVTIRLRQVEGSVIRFDEAEAGSSSCTIPVPGPAEPQAEVSGPDFDGEDEAALNQDTTEPGCGAVQLAGFWELVWHCDDTCWGPIEGTDLLTMAHVGKTVTWTDDKDFSYSGTLTACTVTFSGGGANYETSGTLEIGADGHHLTKSSSYTETFPERACKGTCTGMAGKLY